jgi:large subunit ribosomal protein L20
MTRVKRGTIAHKRRKNVLQETKGFKWQRKAKYRAAKEAWRHAQVHAYADRRRKKRDFRALWQIKINAATRKNGLSYSRFIHQLKLKEIQLDRKILSQLAEKYPKVFKAIVEKAKD